MVIKFIRNFLLSLTFIFLLGQVNAQVWPGDVNNNGIVNGADLLYLGSVYGSTGPGRAEESTDWEAQPIIEAWGDFFPNGVNYAFADCNGDGVVDDADFEEAILENFGEVHSGSGEADFQNGTPGVNIPISFSPNVSFEDGNLILKIGLLLGNEQFEVQDFYGMALQMSYNTTIVENLDFEFALTEDSWIDGPAEENSAVLFEEDDDTNRAELAITLIDPNQSRAGLGRIGEFSIVMEDIIVGLIQDTFNIQIDSITLLTSEIAKIAIVPDTISFVLSEDLLILSNDESLTNQSTAGWVYPNPSNGHFTIGADAPIENIQVFNLIGQRIPFTLHPTSSNQVAIELSRAIPGTYIIAGRTPQAHFTTKIILTN